MKVKILFNEVIKVLFIFFITFVWVNYYKKNFYQALPIAILISIMVYIFICALTKIINKKRNINAHDKKQIDALKTQLLLNSFSENNFYLNELFNIKNTLPILKLDNEKYLIVNFLKTNININSLSEAIEKTKQNNLKNCLIICLSYENNIYNLSQCLSEFKIKFMDINDLYHKIIKPQNFFPKNYLIKSHQKYKIKEIINIALLNSKNTKKFLFYGFLTLLFSFFTFFKIYYIIIGTLLISFAAISKILGKNKIDNSIKFKNHFQIKKIE